MKSLAVHTKELKTLGQYLRRLRITKGYTQRKLASILGITHSSVINWELDRYRPTRKHILNLAKALDPDPAELVKYESVISIRMSQILDFFRANPGLTQRECKEHMGLSWDLDKEIKYLLDIGILIRRKRDGKTNLYWVIER